jgi:predicted secreted protein
MRNVPQPQTGAATAVAAGTFFRAPVSHRQRRDMLNTGAAAAVALGIFFPVLRDRTARGILF